MFSLDGWENLRTLLMSDLNFCFDITLKNCKQLYDFIVLSLKLKNQSYLLHPSMYIYISCVTFADQNGHSLIPAASQVMWTNVSSLLICISACVKGLGVLESGI